MAIACAHCGSADVVSQFSTFCCLSCNGHTDSLGQKVLPTSLQVPPNTEANLRQFGATTIPPGLLELESPAASMDATAAFTCPLCGSGYDAASLTARYGDPFAPKEDDRV